MGRRRPASLALPLGRRECRIIFREMVRADLEAGVLRRSRRRRLQRYARGLGLTPVEAQLIISEVQHDNGRLDPPRLLSPQVRRGQLQSAGLHHGRLRNMLLIAGGVLLLDTWLVSLFF